MGRWQNYYAKELTVDRPPFVGTVWVGYQPLIQVTDKRPPKAFPAWERLVIWKARGSGDRLDELYSHVDTHICAKELVRARLQGDETLEQLTSLYLIDYTRGHEVFRDFADDKLPAGIHVKEPAALSESAVVHDSHPDIEEIA